MKKIIFISVMLMFIFVFSFTSCSKEIEETTTQVQTQTLSCPRGEVNCEYPGKCYLYEDANQNKICDNSE
jgi:hypothetical protein